MKTWKPNTPLKLFPVLAITFGVLAPIPATANIVEVCIEDNCTITFGYTGGTESLTLPASATNIRFDVYGAQGGKTGGAGGRVTGSISEIPSTIFITVGGVGQSSASAPGGFNGGGTAGANAGMEGSGGGASDIRLGSKLSSRIVVAGGGGGRGSGLGSAGGAGGSLIGASGKTGQGGGGTGGTQEAGGIGGLPNGEGIAGTQGELGIGGTGGSGPLHGGGGGGGGYFGGGGGGPDADWCCSDAGGGGGGSSYTDPAFVTDVVHYQGVRQGSGQIIISYQLGGESEPEPPADEMEKTPVEEPVSAPTDEPTAQPNTEEQTTSDPNQPASSEQQLTKPDLSEAEPSSPEQEQSKPEQPVPDKPEPQKEPSTDSELIQDPAAAQEELASEPIGQIQTPSAPDEVAEAPSLEGVISVVAAPEDSQSNQQGVEPDRILQQPTDLRQAAQTVVVPVQSNTEPFSSTTLFAGLIAVAVFALIAALVVARKGVPGALVN